jgi:hypothetical protein
MIKKIELEDALAKSKLTIYTEEWGSRLLVKTENCASNLGVSPNVALAAALLGMPLHELIWIMRFRNE